MDPFSSLAKKIIPLFVHVLQHLDQQAWAPLAPHLDKIVCFHIKGMEPLAFKIVPEGLQLVSDEQADVTFSGPLSAFISFVLTQKLSHQELHIRGDLDCAKAFYDVWQHLDIDWEGHLATLFGPTLASGLFQLMSQTKQWLQGTWQARQQDLGAYLQDEIKLLPTKIEIEQFYKEIDILRDDVERLAARIKRL